MTWEEIKEEMCKDKGLPESVANKIGEFIKYNGSIDVLDQLLNTELGSNEKSEKGLKLLKTFHNYSKILEIDDYIEYNLSLARGLDYYTGIIYEVILKEDGLQVGSIAAGGRYDDLVRTLSENKKFSSPCVGLSIGIERILAIVENKMVENGQVSHPTQCFVISAGKGLVEERLKILKDLWDAGIRAEHPYKLNPRLLSQIQYCEERSIPLIVIVGENELKEGIVKIREVKTRKETSVERTNLIESLKLRLKIQE